MIKREREMDVEQRTEKASNKASRNRSLFGPGQGTTVGELRLSFGTGYWYIYCPSRGRGCCRILTPDRPR
jgi:hypothetical protein